MLHAVDKPLGWLRDHPLEVAIVILTPPLLPASMQAARVFRLLRVLRLLRLGLLTRRLLSTEGIRDAAVIAAMTILALLSITALTVVDQRQQHAAPLSTSPPRPRRTTATRRPAAPAIPVSAGPTARRPGDKLSTASRSTSRSTRRRGHLTLIIGGRA